MPDTASLFLFSMAISIPASASRRITPLDRENSKVSKNVKNIFFYDGDDDHDKEDEGKRRMR